MSYLSGITGAAPIAPTTAPPSPTQSTSGDTFLNTVKLPSSAMATHATNVNNISSEAQISKANSDYANSIPGLAASTLKGLWGASGIPQQFEQGVQQYRANAPAWMGGTAQPHQGPIKAGESALGVGAGIVGAATAPLAPALQYIGKGINLIANPISNIPAVQKFSNTPVGQTTARIAQDVANAAAVGGGILGGLEAFKPNIKGGFLESTTKPETTPPEEPPPPPGAPSRTIAERITPTETPKEEPASPANLKPVASEGEKTTPTLAAKVQAKSVAEKLNTGLGDLPQYNKTDWATQGARAVDLITNHADVAERVAMGQEAPPEGVLASAVFKAVEDNAIKNGDGELSMRLANSPLASATTRMGQEIGYLSEREPMSPVKLIQDVQKARSARATTPHIRQTVSDIRDAIRSTTPTKDEWSQFIDDISCKS